MPGMFITHGYLPPVKADKYVHTTITLELCLETMAQIIKPAWDEWDYGGDIEYLRKECYPLMREMALFYAAYAKKGDDGYYHVIPSMEAERWGFYYQFARNKDVISSLCLFRWGLNRAADAAELLGVDADLRGQWRQVAAQIVPYATWDTPNGPEFAAIRGVEPKHMPGDHFGEAASIPRSWPTKSTWILPRAKDMMLRTVQTLAGAGTSGSTVLLLGIQPRPAAARPAPVAGPVTTARPCSTAAAGGFHPRLAHVPMSPSRGAAGAGRRRDNAAANAAASQNHHFIALLEDDDKWEPNFLAWALACLETCDFVSSKSA